MDSLRQAPTADSPVWADEVGDVVERLGASTSAGLTTDEATARLARFGRNELRAKPRDPAWLRFARQLADPLVYLLLAALAVAVLVWMLEGAEGISVDALVIAAIVLANALVGFVQENRAATAVAALAAMTQTTVTVVRDGTPLRIPSAELVPGDLLRLAEGDAVGADARLVEAAALRVQEASLTGESDAVVKHLGSRPCDTPLAERTNMVFKGTAVVAGAGSAVVVATGMATEMGRIAALLDETAAPPTPLQQEIARISRRLGILVIGIAVVVMAALALVNRPETLDEAVDILLLGVSLAVAAVPEGLPAILSLVLALGVRALAEHDAILKDLPSAETLGSVTVICTDKTGTLTRGEMTARQLRTASGSLRLDDVGYATLGGVSASGPAALAEGAAAVLAGALAGDAALRGDDDAREALGDPTDAAFLVAAHKVPGLVDELAACSRLGLVPFSSERRRMSVVVRFGDGRIRVVTKGAPDLLLPLCTRRHSADEAAPLTEEARAAIRADILAANRAGHRTIGVAWRDVDPGEAEALAESEAAGEELESGLTWLGLASLIDPPRDEVPAAVALAHRAGVRTVMITGDHPVTARRIALDIGLSGAAEPTVVTGADLADLPEDELGHAVSGATVFARVSPHDKLRIVEALQADGQTVAMTGDGVNDAPALGRADIGIAMGITGTAVTKEAASMILADDDFATIVAAVHRGRIIFDNIRKFMRYLLSSNMGEVATVFGAVVLGGFIGLADPADPAATVVPLLATQLLWINLVTDSGPALAMGIDPEVGDVMARPPRRLGTRLVDGRMWVRIVTIGAVMAALCLLLYDLCLPGGLVGGLEQLRAPADQFVTARTTVFSALVLMQLTNALNSRSDSRSAFLHLFDNHWLWAAIGVAVAAQVAVVEVPALQHAFGTAPMDARHWAAAVAAALVVLAFEEAAKLTRRLGRTRRHSPAA